MNKYNTKKTYLEAIGLFIWLGSILSMFLVAHWGATVASLLMSNVIYILLIRRCAYEEGRNLTTARYTLAGIGVTLALIWVFTKNYNVLIILQMLECYVGLFELVVHLFQKKDAWKKGGDVLTRIGFVGWILLAVVFLLISFIFMYVAVNPHSVAIMMRGDAENVTEAPESETVQLDSGTYLTNDIQYTERFANGYFDIYSASEDFSEAKPVFIYIHGGYWVYGDKMSEDPNAEELAGYYKMINRLVDEGFQVISVNYALAPDFAYPTPIHQMEDLANFLKEHGEEYGIDVNRIVFGGGGTGAQIAAQFVITQTNEVYAEELHIEQVLTNDEIKAVYMGTALLEPSQVTDSDVFFVDYILYQMARSYFDAGSMEESPRAEQANIIKHVTEDFPVAYITDGNYMTYYRQAKELSEKLTELGVYNEMLNFNQDEYEGELITQGYDIMNSEFAEMNLEQMTVFMKEQVLAK